MSDIKYLINKYGIFTFTNQEVINQSKIFKQMQEDLGYLKEFHISDNFTDNTINTYLQLIKCINEKDNILDNIDITSNFLEFINYLDAENILNKLSIYLNKNNSKLVNMVNYDTKINIFINFDYNKLPHSLKYDPYFKNKWIEKRLNSKFKYYKSIGNSIKIFNYLDSDNSIIKSFNIDEYTMWIEYNNISMNMDLFYENTYYNNKFLWNIIKNKLMVEDSYIRDIENKFFKNIPNYIDIYNNKIYNYDDLKGKFVQTTENQWESTWTFRYISNNDKNENLYENLTIEKKNNNQIIIIVGCQYVEKLKKLTNFFGQTENDINTKKVWNFIKNKLIITEEYKSKMQEIIDYMNSIRDQFDE